MEADKPNGSASAQFAAPSTTMTSISGDGNNKPNGEPTVTHTGDIAADLDHAVPPKSAPADTSMATKSLDAVPNGSDDRTASNGADKPSDAASKRLSRSRSPSQHRSRKRSVSKGSRSRSPRYSRSRSPRRDHGSSRYGRGAPRYRSPRSRSRSRSGGRFRSRSRSRSPGRHGGGGRYGSSRRGGYGGGRDYRDRGGDRYGSSRGYGGGGSGGGDVCPRYSRDKGERFYRGERCFHCGEMGHWARDCPDMDGRGRCFHCGENGHMARSCPSKQRGVPGYRGASSRGQYKLSWNAMNRERIRPMGRAPSGRSGGGPRYGRRSGSRDRFRD